MKILKEINNSKLILIISNNKKKKKNHKILKNSIKIYRKIKK